MIKIVRSDHELTEDLLNQWEISGLTLISVNHVRTMEYPSWSGMGESKMEVIRWVYHFRSAAKKSSGPSPYDASAPRSPRQRVVRGGPRG